MKVYFDVSTLNPDKITGIGVYMFQIFAHLKQNPEVSLIPVINPSRRRKKKQIEKHLQHPVQFITPWMGLFEKDSLYHGPDFKISAMGFLPRIVTIHDMVVFEQRYNKPEFFKKGIAALTKTLTCPPDGVIVNSQFTKRALLKYFPGLEDRTFITYLGCDQRAIDEGANRLSVATTAMDSGSGTGLGARPDSFAVSAATATATNTNDFILFLGTLEYRKNIIGIIKAFEILCEQGQEADLILAGSWGFGAEEIKATISASKYKDRIVQLNYVSNEKAAELFKSAQVFVFPSWYEGFGIPVIEAMLAGCPVVTAAGGVLEEITEGAAILAAPDSPESIANAVKQLLENKELRQEQVAKGRMQAQKFTWKKCADETLAAYKKVLDLY